MQDLADAAALAGAAELDGASDALTRADNRARNMLRNDPRWSDVAGVQIQSVTFYSAISTGGDTPTTDPKQATFIKITTGSWQIVPSFLIAVGATSNQSTSASAIAGVGFNTCAPVQSYICNPFESNSSTGNAASFPGNLQSGNMFHLFTGGSGGPGSWGLLDLPQGVNNYAAFFSQASSGTCNIDARVGNRTGNGQHNDIQGGINVRFDQRASGNGVDNIAAPIVIDGKATTGGSSCTNPPDVSVTSPPLPRDLGFTGNVGNASPSLAALNNYWQLHHGANWPTANGQPISRYEAYLREVAGTGNAGTWLTDAVEPRGPQCNAASADPRRRVLSVAVVDCNYWGVHGNSTFQYTKYADFFISESAQTAGSDASVYAEYMQTYSPNEAGSALHKTVKLYR